MSESPAVVRRANAYQQPSAHAPTHFGSAIEAWYPLPDSTDEGPAARAVDCAYGSSNLHDDATLQVRSRLFPLVAAHTYPPLDSPALSARTHAHVRTRANAAVARAARHHGAHPIPHGPGEQLDLTAAIRTVTMFDFGDSV